MALPRTVLVAAALLCAGSGASSAWKQLSPPTSFSISQQHPAAGASSSGHNALSDASGEAHSSSSITFGNTFLDNHATGHEATLLGSDDSGSHEEPEPRILHHQPDPVYDSSYFNHLGSPSFGASHDQCTTDKYAFEHEGTVQYEQTLPKLDQFTLCAWMRFTNHSGDHTIFTYSLPDSSREIQFWIANANGASYFSLAVHGQSLYRLNYPLKMRYWHHACTSWNGKTGEWQVWVKAERVGRGFQNRIVGHVIEPHGTLYSGGPSKTGPVDHDLHMEVTMLQMYKVALSAGKAHRDHKHHHVHHFNHDGLAPVTQAPPAQFQPESLQPVNPLLANGQIATRLRINLAGGNPEDAQQQQVLPVQLQHATIGTSFVSGQYSPAERFISQQLVGTHVIPQTVGNTFKFPNGASSPSSYVIGAPNTQYIETLDDNQHALFKRNNKAVAKRETSKKHDKRALVQLSDGSVVDDSQLTQSTVDGGDYDFDGLAQFGAPSFRAELSKHMDIEDEIKQHDREPAEGEVQAVLKMCTACDAEPFKGAIIFAWKDVKHVQTKYAIKGHSLGGCGHF